MKICFIILAKLVLWTYNIIANNENWTANNKILHKQIGVQLLILDTQK